MSDIFTQALEGKRGKHQQLIAEAVAKEWGEFVLAKNTDYGSAIFDPPVLAPHIKASDAILVRLSDKLTRAKNLLATDSPGMVADETIDDTFFDFVSYRMLQGVAKRIEEESQPSGIPPWEDREPVPREVVYVAGVPYEIPDGRDIGSVVAVSDESHEDSMLSGPVTEILREVVRIGSQIMFVDMDGVYWKYALLPEPVPRKTFEQDGFTYDIPDGRDIGRRVLFSDESLQEAASNGAEGVIRSFENGEYRSQDFKWKYALMGTEPEPKAREGKK